MHGPEIEYVKEAYETNWMSTVGKNINEVERMDVNISAANTQLHYQQWNSVIASGNETVKVLKHMVCQKLGMVH